MVPRSSRPLTVRRAERAAERRGGQVHRRACRFGVPQRGQIHEVVHRAVKRTHAVGTSASRSLEAKASPWSRRMSFSSTITNAGGRPVSSSSVARSGETVLSTRRSWSGRYEAQNRRHVASGRVTRDRDARRVEPVALALRGNPPSDGVALLDLHGVSGRWPEPVVDEGDRGLACQSAVARSAPEHPAASVHAQDKGQRCFGATRLMIKTLTSPTSAGTVNQASSTSGFGAASPACAPSSALRTSASGSS
jgi:hypothetical protein